MSDTVGVRPIAVRRAETLEQADMSAMHRTAGVEMRFVAFSNRAMLIGVSCILFAPSLLFANSLQILPAALVVAGCFGAFAIVVFAPKPTGFLAERTPLAHWLGYCAVAAVIFLLGGETHLFFAPWDWLTRDAVLADLVRNGPLTAYRFGDTAYLLRAPLGMYMLPALVGRIAGLAAAHVALLLQNALFLGTIFTLLAGLGRGRLHIVILVLFAGVSIIGAAMRVAWSPRPDVTPFWLGWGLDSWHPMFQFSGTLVQFFWVPNHALPGWWLAVLLLLQVRGQIDLATLGVGVAGALFWSPLAIVPVVPWLAFCAVRRPREALALRTLCGATAAACFVPIAIYMLLASTSIGGGHVGRQDLLFWYPLFVIIQLPVLAFLAVAHKKIATQDIALVVVASLTLLVLLFFRFGPNNDVVMRGSIAPLVVISFVFGAVVVDATRERAKLAVVGWLLVAVSAPSAAVEIGRALSTPRYALSGCSLADASLTLDATGIPTNYATPMHTVPAWLIDTGKAKPASSQSEACWPDRITPRYFGLETIGAPDK